MLLAESVHSESKLSASFFVDALFRGVPVFELAGPVWLEIVGRFSAAAARSAKNRSNSVLVKLSSGPLDPWVCEGRERERENMVN